MAKRQPSKDKSFPIPEDNEPTDDFNDEPMLFEPNQADEGLDHSTSAVPSQQTQVEEFEDKEARGISRYVEDYGQSQIAKWRAAQNEAGHAPWSPYDDL